MLKNTRHCFGRTPAVETLLREHFAKLGVPDDFVVIEANKDAVSFRYLTQLTLRDSAHLIRESSQVCVVWFNVRTTSKEPEPQITFGRKERHATMAEALDALTPHLNPLIRARKSFNFSADTAVKADSPLAAWDLYRSHVQARDFTRAHSLLTGPAATHYGKMQALSGASKIAKLFPDATGFERDDSYSHFVDFHGELTPYLGQDFEMGKLLFQPDKTTQRKAQRGVEMLRTGSYWRIAYMPWNLGKRIRR